jgi:uncharacterized paraquat-inducible protein A
MLDAIFEKGQDVPAERTIKCAGCRCKITVRGESFRDHWAMCPTCAEKFMNGELDTITLYDGKSK